MRLLALLLWTSTALAVDVQLPLTINGTNCASFTISGNILTCASGGSPTGCVATINGVASVGLTSAGGTVGLFVNNCTPASTYTWFKNGNAIGTSQNLPDTLPANTGGMPQTYNYQVSACAGGNCAQFPISPLVATVAAAGWSGTCPGFANTRVMTFTRSTGDRQYTSDLGGFGWNDILVIQIMTASGSSNGTNLPRISGVEYQGPGTNREAMMSDTPCSFATSTDPTKPQYWPASHVYDSYTVSIPFAVGQGPNFDFYPILGNNKTYYLNVKNQNCSFGAICNMAWALSWNSAP